MPGDPERITGPGDTELTGRSADPRPTAAPVAVPVAWSSDDPVFEAKVLRAFIRDGRLTTIPARDRKKQVVYRYLVDRIFPDPDEVVHERDVNMRLALVHRDVATLRRALADLGFVRRDGMLYRRAVPLRSGPAGR